MNDLSQRATGLGVLVTRHSTFSEAEIRSIEGGNSLSFRGYASVFDRSYTVSDWLGDFRESVAPGAFRDSLALGADVPFKINHEGMTLARTKSGTMNLCEDSTGLLVEARLDPNNPHVQALRSAMDRGDIDEMSFSFRCTADTWSDDWMQRTVTGADIHKGDVSVVNYGANPFTSGASLRSADIVRALRSLVPDEIDPELKEALVAALSAPDASTTSASDEVADAARSLYGYRVRALDF
jgi:HK97 family phage prohead protease